MIRESRECGVGDSGWKFHAAHAGVLPLMPRNCRWSGKFMVGVFCGGIRIVVRGIGRVSAYVCVRWWFSQDLGVWLEVEFRTNLPLERQFRGMISF